MIITWTCSSLVTLAAMDAAAMDRDCSFDDGSLKSANPTIASIKECLRLKIKLEIASFMADLVFIDIILINDP